MRHAAALGVNPARYMNESLKLVRALRVVELLLEDAGLPIEPTPAGGRTYLQQAVDALTCEVVPTLETDDPALFAEVNHIFRPWLDREYLLTEKPGIHPACLVTFMQKSGYGPEGSISPVKPVSWSLRVE